MWYDICMAKRINSVFSELSNRTVSISSKDAVQHIVPDDFADKDHGGRAEFKAPLPLIQFSLSRAISDILSDQQQSGWWHALRKNEFMKRPELKEFLHDERLDYEVDNALSEVANSAAESLHALIASEDPEVKTYLKPGESIRTEDDPWADVTHNANVDLQIEALMQLAVKEIGVTRWNKQ